MNYSPSKKLIGTILLTLIPALAPVLVLVIMRYAAFKTLFDSWVYWVMAVGYGAAIVTFSIASLLNMIRNRVFNLVLNIVLLVGIITLFVLAFVFNGYRKGALLQVAVGSSILFACFRSMHYIDQDEFDRDDGAYGYLGMTFIMGAYTLVMAILMSYDVLPHVIHIIIAALVMAATLGQVTRSYFKYGEIEFIKTHQHPGDKPIEGPVWALSDRTIALLIQGYDKYLQDVSESINYIAERVAPGITTQEQLDEANKDFKEWLDGVSNARDDIIDFIHKIAREVYSSKDYGTKIIYSLNGRSRKKEKIDDKSRFIVSIIGCYWEHSYSVGGYSCSQKVEFDDYYIDIEFQEL